MRKGELYEPECTVNVSKPEHAPKVVRDADDYTRDYRGGFVAEAEHPCVHELPSDCKKRRSTVFHHG